MNALWRLLVDKRSGDAVTITIVRSAGDAAGSASPDAYFDSSQGVKAENIRVVLADAQA